MRQYIRSVKHILTAHITFSLMLTTSGHKYLYKHLIVNVFIYQHLCKMHRITYFTHKAHAPTAFLYQCLA